MVWGLKAVCCEVGAPARQARRLHGHLQVVTEAQIERHIAPVAHQRGRGEVASEDGRVWQDDGDQRQRRDREGHGTAGLHGGKEISSSEYAIDDRLSRLRWIPPTS